MLYNAHDTILFSTDYRALNGLLKLTEATSGKYGLRLSKNKCMAIQMKKNGMVHFENNEPVLEAMYLGNEISNDANIKRELLNKMQEVRKTCYKLLPYWKATNESIKRQLYTHI